MENMTRSSSSTGQAGQVSATSCWQAEGSLSAVGCRQNWRAPKTWMEQLLRQGLDGPAFESWMNQLSGGADPRLGWNSFCQELDGPAFEARFSWTSFLGERIQE